MQRIAHPQRLGDRLGEPSGLDVSFLAFFEGWPDDLIRLHSSVEAHTTCDWELVVVDNPVDDDASATIGSLARVAHVPLAKGMGWGAARNLALRLARGRIAVVIDTSVELTGDAAAALSRASADPTIGVLGRWGVRTADGFTFEEASGDVHAVEGYLMAVRREVLASTGLIDPKFRFYRNADLDWSFRVRDAGFRAVADASIPVERHVHRTWTTTPAAERDELSRRNFGIFRRHWGGRPDLWSGA